MLNSFFSFVVTYLLRRRETDDKPQESYSDEIEASDKQQEQAPISEDLSLTQDPAIAEDLSPTQNPTMKPKTGTAQRLWKILVPLATVLTLLLVVWSDVRWKTEGVGEQTGSRRARMTMLPIRWMVLTDAIMVSMWWVAMCLATLRQRWDDYEATQGPKLLFMRR
jgi:cytochrome c-type biogenesis protein CcmH/NrfG